jgi:RNA polymerase sigma factor (sigma-70 family)
LVILSGRKSYTDAELLQALQAHDEAAFGYLYDAYSKALYGVILQIIPQSETAEDVLQDVFVRIWQNIRAYDPQKARLYTWMLNIARHAAIDRLRSKDFNNSTKTAELKENVYEEREGNAGTVADGGLKKVNNGLAPESRRLLELSYFQGYTQEEIARLLGIPLGTVKTRIRTTIMHLRKLIGGNKQ